MPHRMRAAQKEGPCQDILGRGCFMERGKAAQMFQKGPENPTKRPKSKCVCWDLSRQKTKKGEKEDEIDFADQWRAVSLRGGDCGEDHSPLNWWSKIQRA